MTILYVLLAVAILLAIITLHELGHFLVGKACGIGVVEFSIGFGPKLLQWQGRETKYSIRAIPLGGYCAFLGENEDDPDPKAMNNQPVWKRFLTVLAGPAMNFLLGVVIAFLFFAIVPTSAPIVGTLVENMPAVEAGMRAGDRFVSVNGAAIDDDINGVSQVQAAVAASDLTQPLHLVLERDGELVEMDVPLRQTEEGVYQIGIVFGARAMGYDLAATAKYTFEYIDHLMGAMLTSLKNLVFRGEGVEDVSGVVGIVAVMTQEMRRSADTVIAIAVLITMNLGIMNLLPIPALDGGRLVLLIIEAIRRKPLDRQKEAMAVLVTFVLLLGLMAVITARDIIRLFNGYFN